MKDLFYAPYLGEFDEPERPTPAIKADIKEFDNKYAIILELPGCDKENISVNIDDGNLYVAATREEAREIGRGKYLRKEMFSGMYKRSFSLAADMNADNVSASYKDGILTIEIPKIKKEQPESKGKTVTIR